VLPPLTVSVKSIIEFPTGSDKAPKRTVIAVKVTDGQYMDERSFVLEIAKPKFANLNSQGNHFSIDGQQIQFMVEDKYSDIDFNISFNDLNHYPEPRSGITRLTSNFLISSFSDLELQVIGLWPVDQLETLGVVNRMELYAYSVDLGWRAYSWFPEPYSYDDQERVSITPVIVNNVSFLGLRRDLADPNEPPLKLTK